MKAKVTIGFGSVLMVVGVGTFVAAGATSPTALIPTLIGGLLLLTGIGMLAPYERFYSRAMIGAAITSAVGLFGAVGSLLSRGDLADPVALMSKMALAVLCGGLLVLYATSIVRPNKRVEHPS